MNTICIIYSCKKNLRKAKLLYDLLDTKINCKCYITYGESTLSTPYVLQGNYLILKCGDQYENLCEKTICMFRSVYELFPDVKGVFKCDDDIIPNIKKMNELITTVNTNDIPYLGYVWDLPNDYNSNWHYNKCSSTSYNTPKVCKKSKYAAGPLYYMNNRSIQTLIYNANYNDYFFEDSMVGHVLNEHGIFPQHDVTHTDKIDDTTNNIHNCNNNKYIFILLMGGIGNQMFQITCAYTLAKLHNRFVVVLIPNNRAIMIAHNTSDNEYMINVFKNFNYTYYSNIDMIGVNTYREQSWFEYNPNIITQNTDYMLTGYFQNKNYFNPSILPLFRYDKICNELQQSYSKLNHSYFIHFRLGDYLTSGDLYKFDKDKYYSMAIQLIFTIHKDAHFYILSDDIEFIKTYPILNGLNKTIIEGLDTVQSLYLMSLCNYGGICANSTFSGWGARLNENKNKIVTCPKQWINISQSYEIPFDSIIAL